MALEPIAPTLVACIEAGWRDYFDLVPAEGRIRHSTRTRASVVHDYILHYVRIQFENLTGTSVHEVGRLFFLQVGEELLLRFKKLDLFSRPSAILTNQAVRFMQQRPLELPGLPRRATNVYVGYKLDRAASAIDSIAVVCPDGARNRWVLELGVPPQEAIAFPQSVVPEVPIRQPLVRPRRAPDEERDGAAPVA